MNTQLTLRESDGVTILSPSGDLTLGEGATLLRRALQDLESFGCHRILIDLRHVTRFDSGGLGELVAAHARICGGGGDVKLLNLSKRAHDLLTVTKLLIVFEAFENEAAAVRSFEPALA